MGSLGNLIQVPSQDSDSEGGASGRHRGVGSPPACEGRDGIDSDDCEENTVSGSVQPLGRKQYHPAISRWPTISTWIWLGDLHTVLSNVRLASRSCAERREYPNTGVPLIANCQRALALALDEERSDSDASFCEQVIPRVTVFTARPPLKSGHWRPQVLDGETNDACVFKTTLERARDQDASWPVLPSQSRSEVSQAWVLGGGGRGMVNLIRERGVVVRVVYRHSGIVRYVLVSAGDVALRGSALR